MRKIKIVLIFIVFVGIIFCFNNTTNAFSNGDQVKCKIKSYHYMIKSGFTGNHYERIGEKDYFKKGTVVTYKQNMDYGAQRDGICKVEYKGKTYYIKEVNLEAFSNNSLSAVNKTAQKVYDKYKDTDFSKVAPYDLKSISDTLIQAKLQSTDNTLKLKINNLIQEIAGIAKKLGMDVSEDGTIRRSFNK